MFITKKFTFAFLIVGLSYYWMNYVKRGPVYKSSKSLEDKTVLITGGNTGIGKTTALELAKKGARVIIASRNILKSEKACQDIIQQSKNLNVYAKKLDLMDFENVREFAKWFNQNEEHLDILINNAGIMDVSGKTKSGINKLFAVNHFGHFLLTHLLLDKMKAQSKKRPVRIINVSSDAYKVASLTEDLLYDDSEGLLRLGYVYGATKVANIYFTTELHNRLKEYDITVFSLHPGTIHVGVIDRRKAYIYSIGYIRRRSKGAVATELGHGFSSSFLTKIFHQIIITVFLRDPFYGAQTTLYCALDDDVVNQSGGYFKECSQRSLQSHATNKTLGKMLWDRSIQITGIS